MSLAAPARSQVYVKDSFTATPGTALTAHAGETGAAWSYATAPYQASAYTISPSGDAYASGASTANIAFASGAPATAEFDEYVTVDPLSLLSAQNPGLVARADANGANMYFVHYNTASARWELSKFVGSVQTLLNTYAQTLTAGTPVRLRFQVRDAAKTLYVNGSATVTTTDNSVTQVGRQGLVCDSTATPTTGYHFQQFAVVAPGAGDPFTASSISVSPTTAAAGLGGQVFSVTGSNTGFSGTPFTVSGGTNAFLVSQTVTDATHASLTVNTGTAAGTLTVSDGAGDTATVTLTAPSTPAITTPYTRRFLAPYGPNYAGLSSSLGYTVYDSSGSLLVAHTTGQTTDVSATGQYEASVTLDRAWAGVLLWDAPPGSSPFSEAFDSPAEVATAQAALAPLSAKIGTPAGASVSADIAALPSAASIWTYGTRALTDKAGFQLDLTQALNTASTGDTVGGGLLAARAQGFGKWVIAGTPGTAGATLKIYAADGTTLLRTFDLSTAGSRL